MHNTRAIIVALVGGLGLAGLSIPTHAATFTFVQTSDECSGGCGINTNNVITVSDSGANTSVSAQLAAGWSFILTGAGDATLAFSSTIANLALTAITPGYTLHTPSPAPSLMMDGLVFPASAYGVDCTGCGNGGSSPIGSLINFTITGVSATNFVNALRTATMGANATTATFAADVISANGRTGIIDFSLRAIPIPPAMLLFGTALFGIALLRRRRADSAQYGAQAA
jgi:hypothetical protein